MIPNDERCVCGHLHNMHYYASGRCAKIVTQDGQRCTCREFKPEVYARPTPSEAPTDGE